MVGVGGMGVGALMRTRRRRRRQGVVKMVGAGVDEAGEGAGVLVGAGVGLVAAAGVGGENKNCSFTPLPSSLSRLIVRRERQRHHPGLHAHVAQPLAQTFPGGRGGGSSGRSGVLLLL